jgi:hypothetical protein
MHPEGDRRPRSKALRAHDPGIPDLMTQLESLLHVVWQFESEWRLDDRINLSLSRDEAVSASRERGPESR